MADLKLEGAELKKMVKLGKKKALSFAFCPGSKNEHTFLIDRRKGPEMLGKLARKEGTGKKVAFGTFEVKGRVMEMTCGRTVPQMAKTVKKYLKTQKTLVNVVILDADGNTLESDVEDLPADPTMEDTQADPAAAATEEEPAATSEDQAGDSAPAEDAPADTEEAPVDAAALAARLKALQPAIAAAGGDVADKLKKVMTGAVAQIKSSAFEQADKTVTALENAVAKLGQDVAPAADTEAAEVATAPQPDFRALAARAKALQETISAIAEPAKGKLMTALSSAAQNIKERNHDAADAILGKIENAVNKTLAAATDATAADGDAKKWETALARLQPAVDKTMQDKRGDLAAINRTFDYAKDQAADGNYASALKAAAKTAELLKQAATMETTAAAQEAADITPEGLVKLRVAWIETRLGIKEEIEGLKSAIDDATRDVEGMEEVASKSKVLFDYVADIDTNLEQTLQKMADAKDAESRDALKGDAMQIVETYRGVLDSEFFKAVDDNGFVKTSIRSTALNSLQQVSAALAA
ncbi:hypothetical protein [Sedimentitalea todarodis]|uniref:Uncharacterized protein n=1 Tax=Sedimentitalea todarodis TaxID=1631240 RepID=A0ABU3VIF9_9RHOB|nr:hypothetical protein [Sedimentitalea todarodis]MDU9005940.1 hypothetical protein [Sedimentitalea todarodis]